MSGMADMKSSITRLQDALGRTEVLRPGLPIEALEGLDVIQENANLMRAEMDELVAELPPIMGVDDAMTPDTQEKLDNSVAMMTRTSELLEAWLEEWGA